MPPCTHNVVLHILTANLMPCNRHKQRVVSCPACSAEHALNQCILALGPRNTAQYKTLVRRFCVTRRSPAVIFKGTLYMHKVHALALFISNAGLPATCVNKLPAPPEICQLLLSRKTDRYIAARVQFLPRNMVRQWTPLGIYNKRSMLERVQKADIAGLLLVKLAGEYEGACIDLLALLSDNSVFSDNKTVWSTNLFPQQSVDILLKWNALKASTF